MAKKKESRFEAAGWLFWIITSVVLMPPSIWFFWSKKPEEATWLYPFGMGAVIAALAAGFITWIVNSIIQWRLKRKHLQERKNAKKQ